jgi:hypothetical protein
MLQIVSTPLALLLSIPPQHELALLGELDPCDMARRCDSPWYGHGCMILFVSFAF